METPSINDGMSMDAGVDIGAELPRTGKGLHMCMIYSDEAERRSTIAKYLRGGLLQGECVGCFVNSMPGNEVPDWINRVTEDIPAGEREGQLLVRPGEQAYCPQGEFEAERMLDTLRDFYTDAMSQGFSGARVAGDAGFILKDIPGTENFIRYESQVNDLLEGYPITALCQYDANLFDGGTLYDVLRVHPLIIVNGQIVRNVAYQSPRAGAGGIDSTRDNATKQ